MVRLKVYYLSRLQSELLNFNSSMVRLKEDEVKLLTRDTIIFQFQYGAIKSRLDFKKNILIFKRS
mgnify:CR=1 FL=1